MNNWLAPALVLAGVVITALVTYFVAKRNTSGSVSTSDAASLWKESNNLRAEYKERAENLEAQLKEVNHRLNEVMAQLQQLKGNSELMEQKIKDLQQIISDLRLENQRLLDLKKGI